MNIPANESTTRIVPPDPSNNFGTTEINENTASKSRPILKLQPSVASKPTLEEEADRCFQANGGNGLFASDNAKIEVLNAAYGLALLLVGGGEAVCKAILDHDYFADRQRKPGVEKPYLIAIQLGAKPDCDQSHKVCSDYATVLEHAADCAISTSSFADWFVHTPVQACLKAVRAKRKLTRAASAVVDETREPRSWKDTPVSDVYVPADTDRNFISLAGQKAAIRLPSLLSDALSEVLDDTESYSDEDILHAFEMAVGLARTKMSSSRPTDVPRSADQHSEEA